MGVGEIKELLGKQLLLLSERSHASCAESDLASLTGEMAKITELLLTMI